MRKSTKGIPRPNSRGPRPQVWKSGPDLERHKKYRVYVQQRNQAQWREEGWDLTFDQWCDLWADLWDQRGRVKGTYCMTRSDWSLPWDTTNCVIITREEHAKVQGQAIAQGWRSPARKKYRARKGMPDQVYKRKTHQCE